MQKQARPAYSPARPWGELPLYAAAQDTALDQYECQVEKLLAWAAGKDPAAVACNAQSSPE